MLLAVDGGGVASVGCVVVSRQLGVCMSHRGRWWSCVVFTGTGGRLQHVMLFACCCVACTLLCRFCVVESLPRCRVVSAFWLSSLGGCGSGCCPS